MSAAACLEFPDSARDRWPTTRIRHRHRVNVRGRQLADIGDLTTESGVVIPDVRMAYETWGELNEAGDNAVLILHALTGDSHVVGTTGPEQPTPGWWDGLIGEGKPLDPAKYFVIAANVLGGCRGTTGPSSPAPDGTPYGSRFPRVTIRDQVQAEAKLADALGIAEFAAVIGGSMGGMRVLEWAVMFPNRVRRAIALATCAAFSGDQIAWATPQLAAIRLDPRFRGGDYYPESGGDGPPLLGMAIARQIAHSTYRSAAEFNVRFGRDHQDGEDALSDGRFAVESYLQYHGDKIGARFDPNSYLRLTESMNSQDLGRGRGGIEAALAMITAELTVAVVDSDRLFPPWQGELIATAPTARPLITIESDYGHDGFLIESLQVGQIIAEALAG